MEKNSANLTDKWHVDKYMTKELEEFDKLPSDEIKDVKKLWNYCLGPSRTKVKTLSVGIDSRIWLLEHQGLVNLDDKLLDRVETAFDGLVNKLVDDTKRTSVNKTWMALKSAMK